MSEKKKSRKCDAGGKAGTQGALSYMRQTIKRKVAQHALLKKRVNKSDAKLLAAKRELLANIGAIVETDPDFRAALLALLKTKQKRN